MDTNEINRRILNLLRKGRVLEVDHQAALCRVATGELQTNWIPWLVASAGKTRTWGPPTEGEQVMLLAPGGDLADAVAVRGIYSSAAPAPDNSETTHVTVYEDGARLEYDHAAHRLSCSFPEGAEVLIEAPGSVKVQTKEAIIVADRVTLDAAQVIATGNLQVDGTIDAGGDITTAAKVTATGNISSSAEVSAGGVKLSTHKHMEQGDGKPTGAPLP